MNKQIVLAITGPIASGKDYAISVFLKHKAVVIDADKIGHEIIEPQSDAWRAIVKLFGSKVLNRGGIINRKKLGALVFSDKKLLKKLNAIVHPKMKERIAQEIKYAKASGKKIVVLNAALIKEMKLINLVDKVILVISPKAARIKRSLAMGRTKEQTERIIKAQLSDAEYKDLSDIVINNDKSVQDLRLKIKKVIGSIWSNLK